MLENTFVNRVLHKTLWTVLLPGCMLWPAAVAHYRTDARPAAIQAAREMPSHWQGQPLRPLALSEVEERFARHFPGTLSRMTDGRQVLVLRTVDQPTRMLHPAIDCYQGLGYRIAGQQLERDGEDKLWRCFEALQPGGQRLRVCERIVDAAGQGFTDTSAWYWAAVMGQSPGPWQAITVARAL
ncbi:MAG: hypothetical protein JWR60_11 [Polaromonas sp.]|nr:hypothetical protein [Polaromonas sp.]